MRGYAPRYSLSALVASGLALLLGACAAGAPASSGPDGGPARPAPAAASAPQPAALVKTRSAYTTTSAASTPWWVAKEAGYFEEQGLDVDLQRVDAGATLLAAMRNGEIDITGGGGPSMVVGNLQGLETMIIGVNVDRLEGAVFVRPEIQTVDDLRGKTIGVNRIKAITDINARLGLQRLGLTPDVDFFTRGTGGQAEALSAMETGATDGASLNVPAVFEARKRGYREIVNIGELRIPFISAGISTTRRVIQERPELGEPYLRALAQAKSRIKTDRDYAIQILAKYTLSDDPELLGATVDYYRPLYAVDGYPNREAIQNVLDLEENPAARTARPEDVADTRFADRLRASGFLDNLAKEPRG
jgi:NitT/TauT family transport system substrate-binding protein